MFESLSGFFGSAFGSKWAFLAGGLLVSSPIIIHLINRMRFKRIRWAAMCRVWLATPCMDCAHSRSRTACRSATIPAIASSAR